MIDALPRVSLIGVMFVTQVLNAVLLLPLLVAMRGLARDRDTLGEYANGRLGDAAALVALAVVALSIAALAVAAVV